jgi:mono/diheme cytochrome c family protein
MNTRTLQYLLGIVGALFITTGLTSYAVSEPARLETAQTSLLQTNLDEAMTLYAENCSVCHGLAGEGIGATPPLDNEALRQTDMASLAKIIARGLYGTAMPAWSKEDGGPLSDYQIDQLVQLIQAGDWEETRDRVVNLGLAPRVPLTTEPDLEILAGLAGMPEGDLLSQGINLYAQECVACHGPDGLGSSLAPALNDPAVRATPLDELEQILRNGVAGTLMAGWENVLSDEEIAAALALIEQWDQVPTGAIPEPDLPVPVTEESLALGETLYATNCSRCHGPEGQGTQRAPSLNVKGYLGSTSDLALEQIITLGVPDTAMPAWGDRMSAAEIQAIVGFLRAWEPTAPEVAEPARAGGGPWWQTGASSPAGQSGAVGGQGKGKGGGPWWAQDGGAPPGKQNQATPSATPQAQTDSTAPEALAATTTAPLPDSSPALTATEALTATTTTLTHPDGQGGPPEWAGQGETAAGSTHSYTDGSLPPWAAEQQPTAWYRQLDARAWLLLGGATGLAIGLVSLGAAGLWWLKRKTPAAAPEGSSPA